MKEYIPHPVDTRKIVLDEKLGDLCESLAKNAHENWAFQRIFDGWEYGTSRNDAAKQHPCLVPYEELPEAEKDYDRLMVRETLKTILALGYGIEKALGP